MEIGTVRSIYICKSAGASMQKVSSVMAIEGRGLEGDRYFLNCGYWQTVSNPRNTIREVSIIKFSDIEKSGFTESETRRNLVIQLEVNLISLIGKSFFIGSAEFKGIEDCTPCKRPSELSGKADFLKIFKNKGGLRAQIIKSGLISETDSIILAD